MLYKNLFFLRVIFFWIQLLLFPNANQQGREVSCEPRSGGWDYQLGQTWWYVCAVYSSGGGNLSCVKCGSLLS